MGLFFSRMRCDPLFCVLAALLLLWIAAMFAVPPFLPYDAYTNDMGARLLPPSAEHILGTDQLGATFSRASSSAVRRAFRRPL